MSSNDPTREELIELLSDLADGALTTESHARLAELLRGSRESRDYYARFMAIHVELLVKQQELFHLAELSALPAPPTPPQAIRQPPSTLHLSRLHVIAALVAFVAVGILAYSFWPGPAGVPVVKQSAAAKIAGLTDAKWVGASSQAGDTLKTGQQLLLQSGSAEITFNSQARVMLQGPAEFVVVDAGACRLLTGRLTAHVPDLAKGFKVHTPDGTVTDLGTDFGVYVGSETGGGRFEDAGEEEQQPGRGPQEDSKQPQVTEVHVFKGQVDVSRSEVGSGKSEAIAQNPTSDPRPPTSTILSAGQAVTISANKIEPLPAADPFKFALDKLQGKPRKVLLSEDFEAYDIGPHNTAIGPWMVQTGTRKGQGVSLDDLRQGVADAKAAGNPVHASYYPAPPVGARNLIVATAVQNPRDTYPLLAREIDGRELAGNCQLLVEFDFGPGQSQPSLAFANEVGHAAGLEFWRNADAAAPAMEWLPRRYFRVRILLSVKGGIPSEARVERSVWQGAEGWVRDGDYQTAVPKLDWTTPPKFVIFGYPAVTPATPGAVFRLDNIRIEVISEK